MASRPKGYGLTGEINRKIQGKYDVDLENEARLWIEELLGESISTEESAGLEPGWQRFHKELKSGVVLCKLINVIRPGSVKRINENKMGFKQMENIGNFLEACESMGMNRVDLFHTADLYDNTNMVQVVNAIAALGRKAQKHGFVGPTFGKKEADANPRQFTEEQLKAGQGVIGLQMGTNQGASQQGMSFGTTRSII